MIDRVPVEAWKYGAGDVCRGQASAVRSVRAPFSGIALQGVGQAVPARSGRAAMVTALASLGLKPGSRIGVPLYCCPVVFKSIRAAGFEPEFVDCAPDDYCVTEETVAAKAGRIEALIAVHMFGHVCDVPAAARAMGGKPVIEDCAQSFGSALGGRPTGTFGTMAVFSFRLGKYLSVGEGAAIYAPDEALRARVVGLSEELPAPTRSAETRHVLGSFLRARLRSKPFWGLAGRTIWRVYNRRTDFIDKSPLVMSRMFRSDMAVLRHRLGLLEAMISAQRANAAFYLKNLELGPGMMFPEKPGRFLNRFMFPVVFPTKGERDEMAAWLDGRGISTARPYEDAIEGGARHYGYSGDCRSAENLLRRTLVVPVHYLLKKKDVERIARRTNEGWRLVNGRG